MPRTVTQQQNQRRCWKLNLFTRIIHQRYNNQDFFLPSSFHSFQIICIFAACKAGRVLSILFLCAIRKSVMGGRSYLANGGDHEAMVRFAENI